MCGYFQKTLLRSHSAVLYFYITSMNITSPSYPPVASSILQILSLLDVFEDSESYFLSPRISLTLVLLPQSRCLPPIITPSSDDSDRPMTRRAGVRRSAVYGTQSRSKVPLPRGIPPYLTKFPSAIPTEIDTRPIPNSHLPSSRLCPSLHPRHNPPCDNARRIRA